MSKEFGNYLREKRKERHFTLKVFARLIGKSVSYVSQLESGMRPAPKENILDVISVVLVLNDKEIEKLYDFAAKSRNTIPDDFTNYINSHNEVKEALRISKNHNVPEEDWKQFLNQLKDKFLL